MPNEGINRTTDVRIQHETDGEMTFLGLVTINTTLLLSTLFHHSSTLHRLKGMPSIRYNSLHEFDDEDEIDEIVELRCNFRYTHPFRYFQTFTCTLHSTIKQSSHYHWFLERSWLVSSDPLQDVAWQDVEERFPSDETDNHKRRNEISCLCRTCFDDCSKISTI